MLISRIILVVSLALVAMLWVVTGPEAAAQEEAEQETAADLSPTPVIGREGGSRFDDTSEIREISDPSQVQQVVIDHSVDDDDEVIYGIQMIHNDKDLEFHGGSNGEKRDVFNLENVAAQYITGISGTYSEELGIQSLYIHYAKSNEHEQMSDRFGALHYEQSDYFLKCDSGEEVVGFKGRAGKWINAIGLICRRRNE